MGQFIPWHFCLKRWQAFLIRKILRYLVIKIQFQSGFPLTTFLIYDYDRI